ncbi:hypothetical protein BAUCODRAFT_565211 [Baudoinia panamericana UAMH 10762]|uniref:Uncharacterized protein n=1 Tax=Baudoinia panamericana (strain UAMH 10762) TaxID=717646 RepID=M2ME54_BAUPA|nr:uncharacterized protein BAUCODRAFT_565211 [Baudoinia panamericana UAMH 10762]EMC94866.1 hypothetical protein BAUCODRAFT_565211 [Baudoinia panamericana UAMH 10762]
MTVAQSSLHLCLRHGLLANLWTLQSLVCCGRDVEKGGKLAMQCFDVAVVFFQRNLVLIEVLCYIPCSAGYTYGGRWIHGFHSCEGCDVRLFSHWQHVQTSERYAVNSGRNICVLEVERLKLRPQPACSKGVL